MNRLAGHRQAIGQSGRRLLVIGLWLLATTPCRAQPDAGTLPTDPVRIGILIEPHQPLTPYQQHAHLIQEELISLGKALNHLSTVNPTAYSRLQDSLLTYLNSLKTQDVDYGAPAVYESAMLVLQRLNEQTKNSLINGRRHPDDSPVSTQPLTAPGNGYVVLDHAPLFRRADFRSRRLLLQADEPVTLLRAVPGYYYVQTRLGKGYLPQGMFKANSDQYIDVGQ